jgi:hypothetical protein
MEQMDYVERFGLTEEEIEERLREREALKIAQHKARVEELLAEWVAAHKSPAVIETAEAFLLADEGHVIAELTTDEPASAHSFRVRKRPHPVTLTDAVKALVDASPGVEWADENVTKFSPTYWSGDGIVLLVLYSPAIHGAAPGDSEDEEAQQIAIELPPSVSLLDVREALSTLKGGKA